MRVVGYRAKVDFAVKQFFPHSFRFSRRELAENIFGRCQSLRTDRYEECAQCGHDFTGDILTFLTRARVLLPLASPGC